MRHVAVLFIFIFTCSWGMITEAEEARSHPRDGVVVTPRPDSILVDYFENNRLRVSYLRYMFNRDVNHDEITVYSTTSGRLSIAVRIDSRDRIISVNTGGSWQVCGNVGNYDACMHAMEVYKFWYEGINFERYIREELNRQLHH